MTPGPRRGARRCDVGDGCRHDKQTEHRSTGCPGSEGVAAGAGAAARPAGCTRRRGRTPWPPPSSGRSRLVTKIRATAGTARRAAWPRAPTTTGTTAKRGSATARSPPGQRAEHDAEGQGDRCRCHVAPVAANYVAGFAREVVPNTRPGRGTTSGEMSADSIHSPPGDGVRADADYRPSSQAPVRGDALTARRVVDLDRPAPTSRLGQRQASPPNARTPRSPRPA